VSALLITAESSALRERFGRRAATGALRSVWSKPWRESTRTDWRKRKPAALPSISASLEIFDISNTLDQAFVQAEADRKIFQILRRRHHHELPRERTECRPCSRRFAIPRGALLEQPATR